MLQTVHLPEVTLGPELAGRLKAVKPENWYPISDFLEMLERLDEKLGSYHLKQVGWNIVQKFIAPGLRASGRSAYDVLNTFDQMYSFVCCGGCRTDSDGRAGRGRWLPRHLGRLQERVHG